MRKSGCAIVFAGLLFLVTVPDISLAAPVWYSLGLEDRVVNCILADDTNMVVAGTDSGVSVYWHSAWYHIDMLPTKALVRLPGGAVAAACGNGSRSDGVYIGTVRIYGPPFYIFSISNGNWLMQPTALALKRTVVSRDTTTLLYVGSGSAVAVGQVAKDSLLSLTSLKMPAYAFGVEEPWCAGLHAFSDTGALYAGGSDRGAMPGPGSLLRLDGDSLVIVRRLNVTGLDEGKFFEVGPQELAIGTVDSGVIRYNPATAAWTHLGSPAGEAVLCVRVVTPQVGWSDALYAGTASGVYRSGWTEIGDLKVAPRFLCPMGQWGDLLAATGAGVYLYGNQSTVAYGVQDACMRPASRSAQHVVLVDLRGRRCAQACGSGLSVRIADRTAASIIFRGTKTR
jgi:hypothetical protein